MIFHRATLYWGIDLGLQEEGVFGLNAMWDQLEMVDAVVDMGALHRDRESGCVVGQWSWRHGEGEEFGRWFVAIGESVVKVVLCPGESLLREVTSPSPADDWPARLSGFCEQWSLPLAEPAWVLAMDRV